MLSGLLLVAVAVGCSGQATFKFPTGCDRSSCTAYAQWILSGSSALEFELEGQVEGWVAVGVSADQRMGGNGIDDVFVCQRDASDDKVYAEDTYNPQDQSPRANTLDSNQDGFQTISSSYENGRIACAFNRSIIAENIAEDRNLNESVYLLLAVGSTRGGPTVSIGYHSAQVAAATPVVLTEGQSVAPACIDPLIRSHGILMYIAWVWMVPTGYFFAAYMKPAMPKNGAWFQVHRTLMLASLVPSLVGFVLIFVAFRDSGNPNGLITLGAQNPVGTAHMAFGLIVIVLQLINPIISIFRCKPGSKYRRVFDWVHGKIIGRLVIIFALVSVSLGLWQYSGLAYGQTDNSRYYPFWVWITFLIVYTFWDSFLFIYSKCIGPRLDKMWKKVEKEYETELTNADSCDDKEDPPKKMPLKDAPIHYGFMIFNIILLVAPGLIIMLLIAIGCI